MGPNQPLHVQLGYYRLRYYQLCTYGIWSEYRYNIGIYRFQYVLSVYPAVSSGGQL